MIKDSKYVPYTITSTRFTLEPIHKAATPCSCTLLRANPSTNTHKTCAKPKNLIYLHLDGLEVFLDVYKVSRNSSKLQMAGETHIYSPQT